MARRSKDLTHTLARSFCEVIDELGSSFATDSDGTVCEKTAAALEVKHSSALHILNTWSDLDLVTLERKSAQAKINRMTAKPGAYQRVRQFMRREEKSPISKVAVRVDREMRSIPQAAASRLRLQGLRGDRCR